MLSDVTTLGVEFIVEVDGITVSRQVLGRSLKLRRDGILFRIDFPEAPDAFKHVMTASLRMDDTRTADPMKAYIENTEQDFVTVRLVRVVANVESALSAHDYHQGVPGSVELYQDTFFTLHTMAVQIAAELGHRVSLDLGQTWIEPQGEHPSVVNVAGLVDVVAQEPFGMTIGTVGKIRIIDGDTILQVDHLEALSKALDCGPPSPEELMLAEARYLVESERPVAGDRSTLLAAIAVELRTKRLLRELSTPLNSDALDLLLDNPRDTSMSVHGLFLKAIPVFAPHPLGDSHRSLAPKVQDLFTARNKIAHRGEAVTLQEATRHVGVASAAFAFMNDIGHPADDSGTDAV